MSGACTSAHKDNPAPASRRELQQSTLLNQAGVQERQQQSPHPAMLPNVSQPHPVYTQQLSSATQHPQNGIETAERFT
jgi:hypothetical protein